MRLKLICVVIFIVGIVVAGLSYIYKVRDFNCNDFTSQAEAEKILATNPYDKYGLDRDKDGMACENLK